MSLSDSDVLINDNDRVMNKVLIQIEQLSFKYNQKQNFVLQNIQLTIGQGERLAITGSNGSGKSTLLKILNGLLTVPVSSMLTYPCWPKKEELHSHIGLVLQDPNDQLFMPTLKEDIAFGPKNLNLSDKEVSERVEDALQRVGLRAMADTFPGHLSLGQKRRAAIAAVMAMRPEVLCLDEPTSFLDPAGRRELIAILAQYHGTLIISSHDRDFLQKLTNKNIHLCDGQIAPIPADFWDL